RQATRCVIDPLPAGRRLLYNCCCAIRRILPLPRSGSKSLIRRMRRAVACLIVEACDRAALRLIARRSLRVEGVLDGGRVEMGSADLADGYQSLDTRRDGDPAGKDPLRHAATQQRVDGDRARPLAPAPGD